MSPRNRLIIEQRAAGWSIPKLAIHHDLSQARVSKILSDHKKDVRIAELEREVERLARIIAGPLPSPLGDGVWQVYDRAGRPKVRDPRRV
jgi:hypothetical protein